MEQEQVEWNELRAGEEEQPVRAPQQGGLPASS